MVASVIDGQSPKGHFRTDPAACVERVPVHLTATIDGKTAAIGYIHGKLTLLRDGAVWLEFKSSGMLADQEQFWVIRNKLAMLEPLSEAVKTRAINALKIKTKDNK